MSIKENIDPKKNVITTGAAIVFLLITFVIYLAPMFVEVKADYTDQWYVPVITASLGLIFLLTPDKAAKKALSLVDKFKPNEKPE